MECSLALLGCKGPAMIISRAEDARDAWCAARISLWAGCNDVLPAWVPFALPPRAECEPCAVPFLASFAACTEPSCALAAPSVASEGWWV